MKSKKFLSKTVGLTHFILPLVIFSLALFFLSSCSSDSEEELYLVYFNTRGGTEIGGLVLKENSTVYQPHDPEKSGAHFMGWYIDKELTTPYDFKSLVNSDRTLYAKWSTDTRSGSGGSSSTTVTSTTPTIPVISITKQPAASTPITAGVGNDTLTVEASVTPSATLSYQWYQNTTNNNSGGTSISGATSTTFTIPKTLTRGLVYYYCVVSATGGAKSVPSTVAAVTVNSAPVPVITIDTQPASKSVIVNSINENLTVSASATPSTTLTYQWYQNTTTNNSGGTPISGSTSTSFSVPKTLAEGTYYYYCVISGNDGAAPVSSNVAVITVSPVNTPAITITTQPATSTAVIAGSINSTLNISATVTQSAILSYQWYSNTINNNSGGSSISGATGTSYKVPTTLTEGTYYYYCVVSATGGAKSIPSTVAAVTVDPAPVPVITIGTQPAVTTKVPAGSINSNLNISATVTLSATLSYQWYSSTSGSNTGGSTVGGATGTSFSIPKSLSAGTYYYYCIVSASGGAKPVSSNVATVTVEPAVIPVISIGKHPASISVSFGKISGNLSVSATVTASATLSYQWYSSTTGVNSGGSSISGATSASYTIPTTLNSGTYNYYCVVSASGGAEPVPSNVATVTVYDDRPVYTVTFITGKGSAIGPRTVHEGDTLNMNPVEIPVRDGYYFVGWWEYNPKGGGPRFNPNKPITADITLEAAWMTLEDAEEAGLI